MDGGVIGVGAHKAGDLAHRFHVGADLLIVAAQPAGVGGDHRFVDATGTGCLAIADLPDDGLGSKIFITVGVSAAGGDGFGDLLLLGAAQSTVAEAAGNNSTIGRIESRRFHAEGGATIRGVHLVGAVGSAAAEGIEMAQAADLLHVDGGAAGVGSGFPHSRGRGRTAADSFKGKAVRRVQTGSTHGGLGGEGSIGIPLQGFSFRIFRRFPGIHHRRHRNIGLGLGGGRLLLTGFFFQSGKILIILGNNGGILPIIGDVADFAEPFKSVGRDGGTDKHHHRHEEREESCRFFHRLWVSFPDFGHQKEAAASFAVASNCGDDWLFCEKLQDCNAGARRGLPPGNADAGIFVVRVQQVGPVGRACQKAVYNGLGTAAGGHDDLPGTDKLGVVLPEDGVRGGAVRSGVAQLAAAFPHPGLSHPGEDRVGFQGGRPCLGSGLVGQAQHLGGKGLQVVGEVLLGISRFGRFHRFHRLCCGFRLLRELLRHPDPNLLRAGFRRRWGLHLGTRRLCVGGIGLHRLARAGVDCLKAEHLRGECLGGSCGKDADQHQDDSQALFEHEKQLLSFLRLHPTHRSKGRNLQQLSGIYFTSAACTTSLLVGCPEIQVIRVILFSPVRPR